MSVAYGPGGDAVGEELFQLVTRLYPICRSITGRGVRDTLAVLAAHVPLTIHDVPSGTPAFDWTVPQEWNIRDAYVQDSRGRKVIDFARSNLHVVGYSRPVRARMSLAELKPHLFSLPDRPRWIPYRTTYYADNWGFCLSHEQLVAMPEDEYEVCIDATLADGHLTYGELLLPGERADEILVSCHVCHPSLCNDNLSGIAVATRLAQTLAGRRRRYSHRFLFVPGTIGSIAWLSANRDKVGAIKHGLVLTCVGDSGSVSYKKSRRGDAEIDRAAMHVLERSGENHRIIDFSPYGYDERQYCSPGFNLPVGCMMRSVHGEFPEYHTSADDLTFVRPQYLADSFAKAEAILGVVDANETLVNRNPYCEPQLGKRGIYRAIGGGGGDRTAEMAMLWVLNLSDGAHSLLDIAEQSAMAFAVIRNAADVLLDHDLLARPARQAER
jgi:aminopeptidase-like protein